MFHAGASASARVGSRAVNIRYLPVIHFLSGIARQGLCGELERFRVLVVFAVRGLGSLALVYPTVPING